MTVLAYWLSLWAAAWEFQLSLMPPPAPPPVPPPRRCAVIDLAQWKARHRERAA